MFLPDRNRQLARLLLSTKILMLINIHPVEKMRLGHLPGLLMSQARQALQAKQARQAMQASPHTGQQADKQAPDRGARPASKQASSRGGVPLPPPPLKGGDMEMLMGGGTSVSSTAAPVAAPVAAGGYATAAPAQALAPAKAFVVSPLLKGALYTKINIYIYIYIYTYTYIYSRTNRNEVELGGD